MFTVHRCRRSSDNVVKSILIEAAFNWHVDEGNSDEKEIMVRLDLQDRKREGQTMLHLGKRMEIAVGNTLFQMRQEHDGRRTQIANAIIYQQ